MMIPDWAWKVLQVLIIPVALWAVATHVSAKNVELRLGQLEQKVNQNDQMLEKQKESINETRKDIEIMKVRIDYVAKGIDDIKKMLSEKD